MIVADRKQIIDDVRKDSESAIRIAEERAKKLVDTSEIVRQSQERAKQIITQTTTQNRELKRATNEFIEKQFREAEEAMGTALQKIKLTRQALHAPRKTLAPHNSGPVKTE